MLRRKICAIIAYFSMLMSLLIAQCNVKTLMAAESSDISFVPYMKGVKNDGVEYKLTSTEEFPSNMPTLSDGDAKAFLAFLYNVKSYDKIENNKIEFEIDNIYKIMTGHFGDFNGDLSKIRADINAFSFFARTIIDTYVSNSDNSTEFLRNELIEYLKIELDGMQEVDQKIFFEEKTRCVNQLKDSLYDIMTTQVAKHTGVIVTETILDDVELAISVYDDLFKAPEKALQYIKRAQAILQTIGLTMESEKLGRYSYFASYLDNRNLYSSAQDTIFQFIMDYNFLAAKENSYISSAIDLTTWITGKDSWSNHRTELDRWAEYLYQIEKCVKQKSATSNVPVVTGDFNTGIYTNDSNTILTTIPERTLFVNGGNVKQAENIKVNFKAKTYYTKLQASDIVTIDKKGKTKTKKGKLVVGITDSKDVPILTKGKFPKNTSATKIAKASISKGKIKVTAKSQPGEVYLWVIDTGDAKSSACAKIYVNAAPSTIQLFAQSSNAQDFSSDKKNIYKKDIIELGSSIKLYVYPTYKLNQKKVEIKDATYSISVDKKIADCFEVAQDTKDPHCFIVTASAIKDNKITKGKITIRCDQNGKKATFTATAVNSVQNIIVDYMSGLKTDSTTSSDSVMIIQASETENVIGSFTLNTINSNDKIMTTDKPKIYLMGSETGFDAIQMAKGKVKITSKPSGEQKKLKARMERDQKTVTVTAAKKISVGTSAYCLIVYNTIENKGYKVIKITVA